jgi:DNA-binding winged helix-turn-helix (wHTH) protein
MLGEFTRDRVISFGPFRLLVSQRLLLEGNKPVRIGSRALDLLVALVTRPSELVSKRELFEAGWPGTNVVETNLAVNINAVRRALGDGLPLYRPRRDRR